MGILIGAAAMFAVWQLCELLRPLLTIEDPHHCFLDHN